MEAARTLGWTSLAIVRVPDDWDYDKARAFALADNRTDELSEWNISVLMEIQYELEANGWDMETFGFDALRAPLIADPDAVPSVPARAKAKLGQIIQMGQHRIICGDSTDPRTYQQLMGDDQADAVWTDPPYNVGYVGGTEDQLTIAGDRQEEMEFEAFLRRFFACAFTYTKKGGAIYVCHSDTGGGVFRRTFIAEGWMLKQCLVWVKNAFVLGRQDYHWQHEPILYGWKPGAAHTWIGPRTGATVLDDEVRLVKLKRDEMLAMLTEMRNTSTVLREDKPSRSTEHPTMKPVRLITRTLENHVRPGDIVLDPFAGSGSTMVACEILGAGARLVEIDPHYVDVVVKRYEELTGKKATVVKASK
jgi:DNA modification methylase